MIPLVLYVLGYVMLGALLLSLIYFAYLFYLADRYWRQ